MALGPMMAIATLLAAQPFWERVADPHREEVAALIARARADLAGATSDGAARAERGLLQALRLDPTSFVGTLLLGEAQAGQGRRAAAAASFGRARGLARTPAEESRCSLLAAIESSRAGRFPEALADYDRAIRLGEAQGDAYANSAEILMALGRLGEAQDRYREAIRLEEQARPALPGHDHDEYLALAYYGLGVALDRDEQGLAAREAIARALARDPKLAILDAARDGRSDVFFVPPGDVHYYRGLALMVLGRPGEAIDAFQRFLSERRSDRWMKRAETHLLALAAGNDGSRPKGRLKLVAAGTVRADEGLSAPLVDAALRSHPGLLEPCLDEAPGSVNEATRLSLEVDFDAAGTVLSVRGGGDEWAAFVGCAGKRLKEGLRVPRLAGARTAGVRLDLVVAVRR
jgi:tetratricopeptide (TPR) repeat protein